MMSSSCGFGFPVVGLGLVGVGLVGMLVGGFSGLTAVP